MMNYPLVGFPVIAFDSETTGTDTEKARIVEFGVAYRNGDLDGRSSRLLLNPGVPRSEWTEAQRVCEWQQEELDVVYDGPLFVDAGAKIDAKFAGRLVVGYNVLSYDIPLLHAEQRRAGLPETEFPAVIDLLVFVRRFFRHQRERDLPTISKMLGYRGRSHRAVSDCWATLHVLQHAIDEGKLGPTVGDALRQMAEWKEQQDSDSAKWSYWLYRDRSERTHFGGLTSDTERIAPTLVDVDCPVGKAQGTHRIGDALVIAGDGQEELIGCTCGFPVVLGCGKACGTWVVDADRGLLHWYLTSGKIQLPDAVSDVFRAAMRTPR